MSDFASVFTRGVEHFNAHEFWEAHEAWEELWLAAEGDEVAYLQGLIQLAAAYHHMQRGTLRGAVRLIDAALARLAPFPPLFCALDRSAAEAAAREHRQWAATHDGVRLDENEFPKLRLTGGTISPR